MKEDLNTTQDVHEKHGEELVGFDIFLHELVYILKFGEKLVRFDIFLYHLLYVLISIISHRIGW